MEQDGCRMQEHAPTGVACANVVELVLLGFVRALDTAGLDAVEFDGARGQVYAGDARPKACEHDGFDETGVQAVCV